MSETPLDFAAGDRYEIVDSDGDYVYVERADEPDRGAFISSASTGAYVTKDYAPRLAQAILDAAGVKFSVVANGWQEPGPPPGVPSTEQPY